MTDATPTPPHSPATPPHGQLLLGIDTGGTYTDAVVYDEAHRRVIAKAKAPTTHHDLSVGIAEAIGLAVERAEVDATQIELVSMSTTLATNALVEGAGRPVGAVIIGFDPGVLERGGLATALAGDPAVFVDGGHDPHGREVAPLDLDLLAAQVRAIADRVEGWAVMAQFSVRNPAHELAAAELLRRLTGRTATASHVLSDHLNGPKRAVTAILNARLVPIVDHLVATTERTLGAHGVAAPLMVVRGDGSLVSAAFVRERPIETILSGPAASLVGAAHLTGLDDAIISDIGGTTTDVAVLRHGLPLVSPHGATVGGHRTMVEAVAMHTHGLGGDSQVHHDDRAIGAVVSLGPRRVIPVSHLATVHPTLVQTALDRQLRADRPDDLHGVFVVVSAGEPGGVALAGADADALAVLGPAVGPVSAAADVVRTAAQRRAVEHLARRGVVRLAGFTPTDANHVLGRQTTGDADAAVAVAQLFARRRDRLGRPIADDAPTIAQVVIDTLVRRSAEAVLAAAFDHDGLGDTAVRESVVQAALGGHHGAARLDIGLSTPLVGLGASAPSYYPAVAELVRTTSVVPHDADVANAIGAVVGRVRVAHECTITSPQPGQYVVHAGDEPQTFLSLDAARAEATATLERRVLAELRAAGAGEAEWRHDWHESTVEVSGSPMFVEGRLLVAGSGRPQL